MSAVLTFDILVERELEDLLNSDESEAGARQRLLCSNCAHAVTDREHRIEVGGMHAHRFTNPVGLVFEIGCFRAAGGCLEAGEASEEWTWFRGYGWRFALCAKCRAHLGWSYQSSDGDHFFGLILARLASQP